MARTTEWALVLPESALNQWNSPSPQDPVHTGAELSLPAPCRRAVGRQLLRGGGAPTASGKSTLFDAIEFMFDIFNGDLKAAINRRTQNFQDLVWTRPEESPGFELAAEFEVADNLFRYELKVGEEPGRGVRIVREAGVPRPLAGVRVLGHGKVRHDLQRHARRGSPSCFPCRLWAYYRWTIGRPSIPRATATPSCCIIPMRLARFGMSTSCISFGREQGNSKRRMFLMSATKARNGAAIGKARRTVPQLDTRALRKPARGTATMGAG